MNQEKIGKFINELRKEKNMTQQELANKLGITDRAISKWENGRGLPDYSLVKPLCKELDITINELLSGERIKKEDYQEKLEENILGTLNYSRKKINFIKYVFITIIILIVLLLTIFFILFGIDVYRMRNNEPVFFSTWGLKYAPPINLDDLNIENAIKNYLIKEDEENLKHDKEKTFVAMRTYLITEEKDEYYVYAWILKESYYDESGWLIKGSSTSIPYKFELKKENNTFNIINYTIPRDGSYYDSDMKKIFPNSVLKDMEIIKYDNTLDKLSSEIRSELATYIRNQNQ